MTQSEFLTTFLRASVEFIMEQPDNIIVSKIRPLAVWCTEEIQFGVIQQNLEMSFIGSSRRTN